MFLSDRGKGFIGALEDALSPDVDPRACSHLTVDRQPHLLVAAKMAPGGPSRHDHRVGDQDSGRELVRAKETHRFARLNEEGFVFTQLAQASDNGIEALPVSCG